MTEFTWANIKEYRKHFGEGAIVPGYCGKCPGAAKVGDDPVCTVYAEDAAPRILPDKHGDNAPPDWCPVRHITMRRLCR